MRTVILSEFRGDVLDRLRQAAELLAGHPGSVLRIPPGTYRLSTPRSRSLLADLYAGALGDDPEKVIFTPYYPYDSALTLRGVRDCTIEAEGAVFLLEGLMQAVELRDCQNVTLRGLTVDCAPGPFTVGRVTGQGADYVDVALPPECRATAHTPAPRIVPLDDANGCFGAGCMESFARERLGGNVLRYHGTPALPPCVGDRVVLIHTYHYRPAIYLHGCAGVTLDGVAIRAQAGMGLLAYRCRDLLLRGVEVAPAPGAPISTNTDATHFACCDGTIALERCLIAGSEDDGVNVHSYYYDFTPAGGEAYDLRVDAPTFPHAQVVDAPRPGEVLALCDRATLAETGRYTVLTAVEDRAALCARVTLDRPPEGDGLFLNVSLQPHLEVRGCRFEGILTRCLLIKAPTAHVEDCTFHNCTGTAIHVAPEPDWREGGPSRLVVIEKNRFRRVGFGTYGVHGNAAVLCVAGAAPGPALHGTVRFRDNLISGCPPSRPILACSALARLEAEHNQTEAG